MCSCFVMYLTFLSTLLLIASSDGAYLGNPFSNRTMEFSMSCKKNETGHFTTDFVLKKISPQLPKQWKLRLDHGVTEYGGIQTFHLHGVIVAPPPMPTGYQLFHGIGYYKFHRTAAAFDLASATCAAEGGHLTIINSDAESGVISTILKENSDAGAWAWLGFHDRLKEGEFVTIFGDPLASSGFNKWVASKPNGGTRENCGCVSNKGLYNDAQCDHKFPFVCEYDLSWTAV
ncbi:hemolymph lipopolysaccharide-binding protein-like [Ischnura elegans]|uniref:hemolymph lipopolysaccharide-binding protein-like n=1 Tax=Ischnura elegans TaxID=197161 RepID=UPI001ED86D0D|nr:hemolymph lipopolysaccharide-binding protein-like [Ischnura elegans]